ncbi:MAG: hypothetical protein HY903_11820 [Deltaproteobacteria bacterium]|nr:hypothetical protein [Deltaproteobacteria bacterium]
MVRFDPRRLPAATQDHGADGTRANESSGHDRVGEIRTQSSREATPAAALKIPEAPPERRLSATLSLDQRLASAQLRLVDAQVYLSHSLTTAPLVEASPAAEQGAAKVMVALAGGATPSVEKLVDTVFVAGDERALSLLSPALFAHRRAALEDLPPGAPRDRFLAASDAFIETTCAAILAKLAPSRAAPDRARAMASMLAASQTLDGERMPETYIGEVLYNYTNEPGLPRTLAALEKNRGAAIGVSGALLDVAAAREAGLVVLTDVVPALKDWYLLTVATLLLVDEKAAAQGLDDVRRMHEVRALLHPAAARGEATDAERAASGQAQRAAADTVAGYLRGLGVAEETIGQLRRAHEKGFENGEPPSGCWLTDPKAVAHLTRLALEGRIVATTTDLADRALAPRLTALFAAHGTTIGTVHLSNALEYTAAKRTAVESMAGLPHAPNAIIVTSADYGFDALLGTFDQPKAQPLKDMLGDSGVAATVEKVWFEANGRNLWSTAALELTGKLPDLNAEFPKTFAAFEAARDAMARDLFTQPAKVAEVQLALLRRHESWHLAKEIAPEAELEKCLPSVATTLKEFRSAPSRFEAAFWTHDRRRALVREKATSGGVDPDVLLGMLEPTDVMRLPPRALAFKAADLAWRTTREQARDDAARAVSE